MYETIQRKKALLTRICRSRVYEPKPATEDTILFRTKIISQIPNTETRSL